MLKRNCLLPLFLLLILTFTGCQDQNNYKVTGNSESKDACYYTFTDSQKNTVVIKEKPDKVIALEGSYAETWILAGGELAGVTSDAATERNMELPEKTEVVGSIKNPDLEAILALRPDFVLLSPDIEGHVQIAQTLKKSSISHAFFKVEQYEDYLNMLKICTDITGKEDMYIKNGLEVKRQIDNVISKIDAKTQPSVLFIRAFSNGAKAKADNNITCKMLNDLGTVNIAAKHRSLLEDLSIEEIIEEDPDFILVTTMGDSNKAIEVMKNGIEKNPAWSNLTAVKNNRYIVLPKELFHYKPNARWGESYEYLAKIIYPEKSE